DWAGFASRRRESEARGRVRGIGLSCYIEACAGGEAEPATVRLNRDGTATILIGTQSNGQGHATAYAQLASEQLGLAPEKIDVRQGDTDEIARGGGTGGSRSIPVGGASVAFASRTLAAQLKDLASDALEAAAADLELADGVVRIAGTDRALPLAELAALPRATPERLSATDKFRPPEATYPNGTHVCELEADPQTGHVEILRYTVVDDFGVTLNPLLLMGQVHGGVVQGIGQALLERTVYEEDTGQLVTATFNDYCVPRAEDVPSFVFETRNVPSTTNALGMKGAGEAGTIGACPAVMNALVDALHSAVGLTHIDMPATPERVWGPSRLCGGGRPRNRRVPSAFSVVGDRCRCAACGFPKPARRSGRDRTWREINDSSYRARRPAGRGLRGGRLGRPQPDRDAQEPDEERRRLGQGRRRHGQGRGAL
ncbi:MAG: molybdopterin-dependent oxidoreductase, partial [Pseudomonadota bacterium]|nr:molybdopterin-dependent oxidoreductase [Pseudomonadota bacterium]